MKTQQEFTEMTTQEKRKYYLNLIIGLAKFIGVFYLVGKLLDFALAGLIWTLSKFGRKSR